MSVLFWGRTPHKRARHRTLVLLVLAGCGGAYDDAVAALRAGELDAAERAAADVHGQS